MQKLIALGAVDIVVPGVLPIGCFPIYLTIYGTSNSGDYDSLGCLKKFNDLSTHHNNLLQTKITNLQRKYKSARIMYADFYQGVYDMVQNPQSYGTRAPKPPTLCYHPLSILLQSSRISSCTVSADSTEKKKAVLTAELYQPHTQIR